MRLCSQIPKVAGLTLLTAFSIHFVTTDAMAAKEKFERTKPHVNIGTIGHDQQGPGQLTGNSGGQDGNGDAASQSLDSSANDCRDKSKTTAC